MTEEKSLKVCEDEDNACKREVQALCYHCSKHLCRIHLVRHAVLIEEKTRDELNSLTDKINDLSLRFNEHSIAEDILQKPLAQLEEWRIEAHEKIDQIVVNKQRELQDELEKYRQIFLTNKAEQLAKLNVSKRILTELVKECDASTTQIADLQNSIDDIEKYLNAPHAPKINVILPSAICSIDIRTNHPDGQPLSIDIIRDFKITYVRLNGMIRNYYLKTKKDGKMVDLVESFVRYYAAIEECARNETDQIYRIDHLPKSDFILPVERTGAGWNTNRPYLKITLDYHFDDRVCPFPSSIFLSTT